MRKLYESEIRALAARWLMLARAFFAEARKANNAQETAQLVGMALSMARAAQELCREAGVDSDLSADPVDGDMEKALRDAAASFRASDRLSRDELYDRAGLSEGTSTPGPKYPSVTDQVETLSLTAARKIAAMVLKTPANWVESVLTVRVQAYVREALVAAVQLPDVPETRSFRMTALGVVAEPPQVLDRWGCTGFVLVGTDYVGDQPGTLRRIDTRIPFLAFADVGQEIARSVHTGDQLEVAAWARTSIRHSEPGGRYASLALIVESFRLRRRGPGGRRKRASPPTTPSGAAGTTESRGYGVLARESAA